MLISFHRHTVHSTKMIKFRLSNMTNYMDGRVEKRDVNQGINKF